MSQLTVRRLCVYAHYDRDDVVDEHVYYTLGELSRYFTCLVFVSTASLGAADVERLTGLCDKVELRENKGYDFFSYQLGLGLVELDSYDQVVLHNDSVYGPFFDYEALFSHMDAQGYDFWGLSDSYEYAHHLQSYFVVFNRSVVESESFRCYWQELTEQVSKLEIIKVHEVGLSQALKKAGFNFGALFSTENMGVFDRLRKYPRHYLGVLGRRWNKPDFYRNFFNRLGQKAGMNPTHYQWKDMLTMGGSPYIKVELLRDNPLKIQGVDEATEEIGAISDYPVVRIKDHLQRLRKSQ